MRIFVWLRVFILAMVFTQVNADPMRTGQTIQITTNLHSFVGKPSWLLIVRDLDNGVNRPYLFDVSTGNQFWVALTYGRNYLIKVSNLQFSPYHYQPYASKVVNNFCRLESNGKIARGESMTITLSGDLTPANETYRCTVLRYRNNDFTVVKPGFN